MAKKHSDHLKQDSPKPFTQHFKNHKQMGRVVGHGRDMPNPSTQKYRKGKV